MFYFLEIFILNHYHDRHYSHFPFELQYKKIYNIDTYIKFFLEERKEYFWQEKTSKKPKKGNQQMKWHKSRKKTTLLLKERMEEKTWHCHHKIYSYI